MLAALERSQPAGAVPIWEIEFQMDCKPGGSLVLGCSNATQPQVPIQNYRALIEAWKCYGQYHSG